MGEEHKQSRTITNPLSSTYFPCLILNLTPRMPLGTHTHTALFLPMRLRMLMSQKSRWDEPKKRLNEHK